MPLHASADAAPRSRYATWKSLENAADRWASYGALGFGVAGAALMMIVLL